MEYSQKTVGPEEAKALLEKLMPNYRRPDPRNVELMAREMGAGRWKPDYDPIHVDEELGLVNGRQRLLAVIKAGVRVGFIIVRGKFNFLRESA